MAEATSSKLEQRITEARQRIAEQASPAGVEQRTFSAQVDADYRGEVVVEAREAREGVEAEFEFVGHAAVFDQLSEDLGGWRERIKRGAFRRVLGDDVRFTVNHNPDLLLARTRNGTLRLKEDPTGLATEADIAPTTLGKDLRILVDREDMTQMSFMFIVAEAEWDDENGELVRTITRMEALFDVCACTYPAYPQTDGGARAQAPAGNPAAEVDLRLTGSAPGLVEALERMGGKNLAASAAGGGDPEQDSIESPPEQEQRSGGDAAQPGSEGRSGDPQVTDGPDASEQAEAAKRQAAGRRRRLRLRQQA